MLALEELEASEVWEAMSAHVADASNFPTRAAPKGAGIAFSGRRSRRKRRILFVSHVGRLGGAERTLTDILQTLDRDRFEARVIVPELGELSEVAVAAGASVDCCPNLRRLSRSARLRPLLRQAWDVVVGARRLRRLVIEFRPDVIHANSTTAAFYLLIVPRLIRPPVIWHLRDLTRTSSVERWIGRRAAHIIVPSQACRTFATRIAPASKIDFIPNGIEIRAPSPPATPPAPTLSTSRGPLALMVGQLVPWKGFELALDAAQILGRELPTLHFALVGSDLFSDDPNAIRRLEQKIIESDLVGRFQLLGERDDVPEIMAAADMLVHPAFPEPFGRVVVEAMAARLPVIAFAGDHGPAEIVRDGVDGLLVSPRTPEALAKAICLLAESAEKRRVMGEAGWQRASAFYDRELMVRRIETLYDTVAG